MSINPGALNKQKFINILQNFDNIADHERNRLHELARLYPYSQIIHTLVAKANNDAQTDIAGQTLNFAAMYATDRSVLKDVIKHTPDSSSATSYKRQEEPQQNTILAQVAHEEKISSTTEAEHLQAEHLRKEVWLDLAALKKSKASYLEWLKEDERSGGKKIKSKKTNKDDTKSTPINHGAAIAVKKEKVKEKATKATPAVKKTKAAKAKTSKSVVDKKASAKKALPHEEQKEIIENFITKEPSLAARPLKIVENQPDLSVSSTAFNEDLISENLAQILINQGKKEKALDIYKKLIWKFPQKKSYFASRIEELIN